MFFALRDWWRTDRKEMVVSIITLVALFAMLYFGLWFVAIIEEAESKGEIESIKKEDQEADDAEDIVTGKQIGRASCRERV